MEDYNILMSQKFGKFAMSILELQEKKRLIEVRLMKNKQEYNELLLELNDVRLLVEEIQNQFLVWKKDCYNNCGDG